jgi:uncharacterized phage infection (PIP) family protein YhgE
MGDAERLQAIQSDFSRALEEKITGMMATVQAAREINRQLLEADNETLLLHNEVAATEEHLAQVDDSSDAYEAGLDQVDALQNAIREMQGVSDELTETLGRLVGDL